MNRRDHLPRLHPHADAFLGAQQAMRVLRFGETIGRSHNGCSRRVYAVKTARRSSTES